MPDRHLYSLLLCPTGQDANLIASVLKQNSIDSQIIESVQELSDQDLDQAGMIVIAEEALSHEGIELLNKKLSSQKPWSDIPIILLTSGRGTNNFSMFKRLEVFVTSGNVTLLERPLKPLTLISSAQVALRSRRRQFLVRSLLEKQVQATNMRDEFISIAGHELKTPLTSLKIQTQLATKQMNRDEFLPPERIVKQLDYTSRQVDRLNKLVDDMLDVSRIGTGKLILQKKDISLSALVEELVDRYQPQFEAAGCSIKKDIAHSVHALADSYKIEQVINNLFSNAIRYSPKKPIEVTLKSKPDKAILSVKDHGPGIAPENQERIFDRFERASNNASGLGLGLYITKQIVSLHRGKIFVESELGKGTNFIVELPILNGPV